VILIGVDPHKSSHTAVVVDPAGHQVAQRRFAVNAGTFRQLMRWCEQWPERRFAVEGAGGLGRPLAQQLAAAGESVVDVPSTLSARARLLATGGDRKTDAADALHVAQVALFRPDLRQVAAEDQTMTLRLLTERHDDLVHERTRVLNRLHAVLRDVLPGGVPTGLSADKAASAMRGVRPVTATDNCRRDIARDLLADLRRLDRQVKENEAEMIDERPCHSRADRYSGCGVCADQRREPHAIGRPPACDRNATGSTSATCSRLGDVAGLEMDIHVPENATLDWHRWLRADDVVQDTTARLSDRPKACA
jgi:hypothetical protein